MALIILYIDNPPNAKEEHRICLKKHKYQVLPAGTNGEAFHLFSIHSVDAVIIGERCNLELNVLLRQMKEIKPHVPIMILSGYDRLSENGVKCIDAYVYHAHPEQLFLSSLDRLLNVDSTSFSRWIDNWMSRLKNNAIRGRNDGEDHAKQKKAA
jgi:DNA-binding NtrC family response regulator